METFVLNIVKFQLILEFNSYFTVQVFLKLTVRWKGSECYGDYMYRVRYLSNIRRQTQVSFIPRHQTLDTIQTTCLQSDICLILGDKPRLVLYRDTRHQTLYRQHVYSQIFVLYQTNLGQFYTEIIDTRHYIDYMFTVRHLSNIGSQTQVSFTPRYQTLDTIQTTCLESDICLILGDKPRLVLYRGIRHQTLYRLLGQSQIFV